MIFGGDVPTFTGGWGPSPGASCGSPKDPKAEFDDFSDQMEEKYGQDVETGFIDLMKDDLSPYPEVQKLMGRFNPPLVVINKEPRFHGGLSLNTISEAVDEIKNQKSN